MIETKWYVGLTTRAGRVLDFPDVARRVQEILRSLDVHDFTLTRSIGSWNGQFEECVVVQNLRGDPLDGFGVGMLGYNAATAFAIAFDQEAVLYALSGLKAEFICNPTAPVQDGAPAPPLYEGHGEGTGGLQKHSIGEDYPYTIEGVQAGPDAPTKWRVLCTRTNWRGETHDTYQQAHVELVKLKSQGG